MPRAKDRVVGGVTVYLAERLLAMATEAAGQVAAAGRGRGAAPGLTLQGVEFPAPLHVLSGDDGTETMLHLHLPPVSAQRPEASADAAGPSVEFSVRSFKAGDWRENCAGSIRVECDGPEPDFGGPRQAALDLAWRTARHEGVAGGRHCTRRFALPATLLVRPSASSAAALCSRRPSAPAPSPPN